MSIVGVVVRGSGSGIIIGSRRCMGRNGRSGMGVLNGRRRLLGIGRGIILGLRFWYGDTLRVNCAFLGWGRSVIGSWCAIFFVPVIFGGRGIRICRVCRSLE